MTTSSRFSGFGIKGFRVLGFSDFFSRLNYVIITKL